MWRATDLCLLLQRSLSTFSIFYPPQDHVLLLAMPIAMGHSLEAVGVTSIAIELWTAVLIFFRPANHVGAHAWPWWQLSNTVCMFVRSRSSSQIACMVAMTLITRQTFSLQDCLSYISVAMLTLCLQPMVTMSAIRIASAHNL